MPDREQASEIEDAATVWVARAERGLTTEDRELLDRWIAGDSRRLGAFVRAQAAWVHAERAAALGKMPESEPEALVWADAPAVDQVNSRRISRRMVLGGAGALTASAVAVGVGGWQRYRTIESGVGEIRHIALQGGTTLTLDTDTRVDVALASDDRKLRLLRGKLFLDVTHRQDSPLMVRTGNLVLKMAGGAFGLQSLVREPVTALVTKGQLIVSQSRGFFGSNRVVSIDVDHALVLPPGDQIRTEDVRPMDAVGREQLLAWRDGMLSFGGELLVDAVRAFDRYGTVRIIVADPVLGSQKVTGLFKADDPVGFATAVAASFGGVVTNRGETIRISARNLPKA